MNAISDSVERRSDTGVHNGHLGMWLFLASDAILFATLFSAYVTLRAGAAEAWPPFRDHLVVASINTIVLLGAALALTVALRAARGDDVRAFRRWLHVSGWLALVFIGVKLDEYGDLHAYHLQPSTSRQFAMYVLLTGVHLLHVAGGAVAIAWIGVGQRQRRAASPAATVNRVQAVLLYWYLVALVWLVLFVLMYVV